MAATSAAIVAAAFVPVSQSAPSHPSRSSRKGASLAASSAPARHAAMITAAFSSMAPLSRLSFVPTAHAVCDLTRPKPRASCWQRTSSAILSWLPSVQAPKDAFPRNRGEPKTELEDIPRRTSWLPFVTCAVRDPASARACRTRTFAPTAGGIRTSSAFAPWSMGRPSA